MAMNRRGFEPLTDPRCLRWAALALASIFAACSSPPGPDNNAAGAASQRPPASIVMDVDSRPHAYSDRRFRLARIQSNLERVAAGQPRREIPADQEHEALDRIVDAYAFYLNKDAAAMDAALADVFKTAASRRDPEPKSDAEKYLVESHAAKLKYYAVIDVATKNSSSLVRLIAGLRAVDTTLFLEAADTPFVYLDQHDTHVYGPAQSLPGALSGSWLRLPCRTVVGHAAELDSAAADLKTLGGPLLSCPTDEKNFAAMQALVQAPASFKPHVAEPPRATEPPPAAEPDVPPQQWTRDLAVKHMGENPDAAEPLLTEAAGVDPVGKLDYVLFLHAFRPPSAARNAKINKLLKAVRDAPTRDSCCAYPVEGDHAKYDGSDESLVPTIVTASSSGAVNTESAFYAIPCAVLVARPKLLDAVKSRYGSNLDNFLPRSGCTNGRGSIVGFPESALRDFDLLAQQADGHFVDNYRGTIKYGLETGQAATWEAMRLDPRSFLVVPESASAYPYQTWGWLSLNNYVVAQKIKDQYAAFHGELAAYYRRHDLTADESDRAAKAAIFAAVWGADCGGGVPTKSLRRSLVEGDLPGDEIAQLTSDAPAEAPEIVSCADSAGWDPLFLAAVADPKSLDAMIHAKHDVDERNAIGKTALMIAAQLDRMDSARLLLADHAGVNTTTLQTGSGDELTLSHDARSPLMYAAGNGSLAMIRLLIDAGADPYQTDTKGSRAVDYLLGYGPMPANPRLNADERASAARLLF
jgi:Ankyrin repeats (3 copies)